MLNVKTIFREAAIQFIKMMPWTLQDKLYFFYRFTQSPHILYPQKIIKPHQGSGMERMLTEAPDLAEKHKLIQRCKEWLNKDDSLKASKLHYRYSKPRILIEKRVNDGKSTAIGYRFHIFNKTNDHFKYVLRVFFNHSDNKSLLMLFFVNTLHTCFLISGI